ncbi:MAG: hypothetical protein HXX80_04975 [Nitrososphaerales archaeon]|nr:hypothetical protein [Nitrososphaerales archaeon]
MKKSIATAIIMALILSLLTLPMAYGRPVMGWYGVEEAEGWKIIKTDVITIAVPSTQTIPMFIWWYDNDDGILYSIKYEGLAEAWLFPSEEFGQGKLFEDAKGFKNEFMVRVRANPHGWIENTWFISKIDQVVMSLHPFFFSFFEGVSWGLTEITPIYAIDGNVVGIAFAFILDESMDPNFKFTEGNILIRNTVFLVPVEMQIGDVRATLSKAELKSDIVISGWQWNYDVFMSTFQESSDGSPEANPRLVLSAKFNVLGVGEADRLDVMNQARDDAVGDQYMVEARVMTGDNIMTLSSKIDQEDEIGSRDGIPRLEILAKGSTATGFFDFVPKALIVHEGQIEQVDVEGVYWAINGVVKTFLVYPYFGDCTFEHDPLIGVSSLELEGGAAQYTFTPPVGSKDIVPPSQAINLVPLPTPSLELALGAAIFAVLVIAVISTAKKIKIEVLNDA